MAKRTTFTIEEAISLNNGRGCYEIVFSTCSWPTEKEKEGEAGKLFVFFSCGGNRRKAYFRKPMTEALKEIGIKSITDKVLKAIEETVPEDPIGFRIKKVDKATVYSIHPDHITEWVEEVKKKLEEKI